MIVYLDKTSAVPGGLTAYQKMDVAEAKQETMETITSSLIDTLLQCEIDKKSGRSVKSGMDMRLLTTVRALGDTIRRVRLHCCRRPADLPWCPTTPPTQPMVPWLLLGQLNHQ